jgi:hypothetical protein
MVLLIKINSLHRLCLGDRFIFCLQVQKVAKHIYCKVDYVNRKHVRILISVKQNYVCMCTIHCLTEGNTEY